jgi:hypothetical protein
MDELQKKKKKKIMMMMMMMKNSVSLLTPDGGSRFRVF